MGYNYYSFEIKKTGQGQSFNVDVIDNGIIREEDNTKLLEEDGTSLLEESNG